MIFHKFKFSYSHIWFSKFNKQYQCIWKFYIKFENGHAWIKFWNTFKGPRPKTTIGNTIVPCQL